MAAPGDNIATGPLDPARTPVIIGVGQTIDRAPAHTEGPTPVDLAGRAIELAAADAGGVPLGSVDWLGVVGQISFRDMADLPERLCRRLGLAPAFSHETPPSGDSPMLLLDAAANAIARGEARLAVISGAEALRTAAHRPSGGVQSMGSAPEGDSDLRRRYGLRVASAIYPFYEHATRAAWGQSAAEAQAESAAIWARMATVAAGQEAAAIRTAPDAATIATIDARNRPIAHPYPKFMVANASVNQGAALIVASLAMARALGVADERIVHIGAGAAAHESEDPLARDRYDTSPAMQVAIERALSRNNVTAGDLDMVELYSCFPCVPKMARRILGWPIERPVTCFGGLTFGGGPIANYMTHAAASMVDRLRATGGRGLLFANGGYATHNHAMLLTREPPPTPRFPQEASAQAEADALRAPPPAVDDRQGDPARLETYTLLYDRAGAPDYGALLCRRPDGSRLIARIDGDDAALVALLTDGVREPVGMQGLATHGDDGRLRWHPVP